MKKLKYVKFFENFLVNQYGSEVETISQIITFSLTDISKSHFDTHTWIKKWETDMELKSDGSDAEERIKKIGEMKYFLDEFQVYFYYDDIDKRYPSTNYRFDFTKNQKFNQEYKSNLEKILGLNQTSNQNSDQNYQSIKELPTNMFDEYSPNIVGAKTFLVGYGNIQTTEKVAYERFNYYCLVTVAFSYNSDESIEFLPFDILVKESEPGQEEVVGARSGIYCKIDREQWEIGLKPGDTDHRGFFKITSVEETLGILRGYEKYVRKK